MSRRTALGVSLYVVLVSSAPAAETAAPRPEPQVARVVGFAVSERVADLRSAPPDFSSEFPAEWMRENEPLPKVRKPAADGAAEDRALQSWFPAPNMPAPITSFDGLSNADSFGVFGFFLYPPDTNAAVGPNHVVETVNIVFRIYDKAGAPLTGPLKMSSLFASLGGTCADVDHGDPIVVYDQLADRWLVTQFALPGGSSPPYHECMAVSTSGDPTGTYYLYDYVTPGNEFPDYPKFGVWPDAYYMTTVQFLNGQTFDGTGAFAFDRAKMLAGDPTATGLYFNLNLSSHPEGIGGMLPSSLDGLRIPPAGAPNVFSYFTALDFSEPGDALRLFDFNADFVTPANSTFTERGESPLAVSAFHVDPAGRNDVPQPPPSTVFSRADAIGDRLMYRLAYRNFGTHESLVANHTVDADATSAFRAGVRYYELRRTGAAWTVQEQATYAPPGTEHRWVGSVAQDNAGNLAVGYSVSSAAVFRCVMRGGSRPIRRAVSSRESRRWSRGPGSRRAVPDGETTARCSSTPPTSAPSGTRRSITPRRARRVRVSAG